MFMQTTEIHCLKAMGADIQLAQKGALKEIWAKEALKRHRPKVLRKQTEKTERNKTWLCPLQGHELS